MGEIMHKDHKEEVTSPRSRLGLGNESSAAAESVLPIVKANVRRVGEDGKPATEEVRGFDCGAIAHAGTRRRGW